MDQTSPESRLSRISTIWSTLRNAHADDAASTTASFRALVERYEGAVYRYLLGATKDRDVADELFQEFAVKLVRGGFGNVTPEKGRFRDYLRRVLINLITDHYRTQRSGDLSLDGNRDLPFDEDKNTSLFDAGYRDELLHRTWSELETLSQNAKQPYFKALKCRVDHPDVSSEELAELFTRVLDHSYSAVSARKVIQRARAKFATLLLDEISRSIESAKLDRVEEEVIELGLQEYCRSAIAQRRRQHR